MSKKHPIIAVTGSSGSGTTFVRQLFEKIFRHENIKAALVQGDGFHCVTRDEFIKQAKELEHFSHFGPESNDFHALERLFRSFGEYGNGQLRYYLHNEAEAAFHCERLAEKGIQYQARAGEFTPWEYLECTNDVLLYEGLHGLVVDESEQQKYGGYNVASHVDLGIGIVPSINLEWIQKIQRDKVDRGYRTQEVVESILRRLPDYVHHITPQFSRTDINFQRVPTVDTSNPFIARDIPTADESFVVIRVDEPAKWQVDFPYLLSLIQHSFMSRHNTLVVPGGKMAMAMELILSPIVHRLIEARQES